MRAELSQLKESCSDGEAIIDFLRHEIQRPAVLQQLRNGVSIADVACSLTAPANLVQSQSNPIDNPFANTNLDHILDPILSSLPCTALSSFSIDPVLPNQVEETRQLPPSLVRSHLTNIALAFDPETQIEKLRRSFRDGNPPIIESTRE